MGSDRWAEIWEVRRVPDDATSVLAGLMAADGLDTAFGTVEEAAWSTFVRDAAHKLGVRPGERVFEVGCGAGAFLYELERLGASVGGVDRSASLIVAARRAIPSGRFAVGEAAELDAADRAEFVTSFGVFMYFPSLAYAERVIDRMARMATRAVAILDLPDAALKAESLAARHAAAGGRAAYEARYAGLEHRYYARAWIEERLRAAGLTSVGTTDQAIAGYANGRHRFNAWARVG